MPPRSHLGIDATAAPETAQQRRDAMRRNLNPHGHGYTGTRLSPTTWTPLHLQLLLHYYTMPEILPNSSAPAVLAYTDDLKENGLIESRTDVRQRAGEHPWKVTPRGEAHIRTLTSLVLPWEEPKPVEPVDHKDLAKWKMHERRSLPPRMTNLCQEVMLPGPPTFRTVTKEMLEEIKALQPQHETVRWADFLPVMIEEADGGTITRFEGWFLVLEDKTNDPSERIQFCICFPDQDGPGFTLMRTIPAIAGYDISSTDEEVQEMHPFLNWNLTDTQFSRALKLLPDYQQRRARVARLATKGPNLPKNPFAADYTTALKIRQRPRTVGGTDLKSDTYGPPDSHGG